MRPVGGRRVAVLGADAAFHARLRAAFGLSSSLAAAPVPHDVAYCGAEYRVYPFMRIADAVRFFSAMHGRWDSSQLEGDFALAGLGPTFEVRRMKRAYQRALVLALSTAWAPETLVVEAAEEFSDAEGAAALLARAVARAPAAIVTYGGDSTHDPRCTSFTETVAATAFEARVRT